MQQASYSTKDPINILSSQNIFQHICKAYIDPKHTHTHTHTHTLNKSNQFYILKLVKTV